jgi:biopolymer transport protein ExbD
LNGLEIRDVEYDPKKLDRKTMEYSDMPMNPGLNMPFTKQEREEIKLVAYDTDDNLNFTNAVKGYYSITKKEGNRVIQDGGDLLVREDGQLVDTLKIGETVYALATQFSSSVLAERNVLEGSDTTEIQARRKIVVQDVSDYEYREVSAYDLLKSLLVQIRERFPDVEDRNSLIIAADDQIIYDKIIQVMDIARSSNLSEISIARMREQE